MTKQQSTEKRIAAGKGCCSRSRLRSRTDKDMYSFLICSACGWRSRTKSRRAGFTSTCVGHPAADVVEFRRGEEQFFLCTACNASQAPKDVYTAMNRCPFCMEAGGLLRDMLTGEYSCEKCEVVWTLEEGAEGRPYLCMKGVPTCPT